MLRAVPPEATAPVLILVGVMMLGAVRKIPWDDLSDAVPAFLTLVGIAFTFSIADGMALGFVSYAVVKTLSGRAREVGWINWIIATVFIVRYAVL